MEEINSIFTPEEIILALRAVSKFFFLFLANLIGTFTRGAIFKNENTRSQSVGFSILSTTIAFWLTLVIDTSSVFIFGLLISIPIGFFIPSFKNMLKGVKLIKIILKAMSNASSVTDNIVQELDKELEGEE